MAKVVNKAKKVLKKSQKPTKKAKLKTRVAVILDRSGSMQDMRAEAISVFNQQVDTIKKAAKDSDTKVSFVTFSTEADKPVIWNEPVEKLKPITEKDYSPDGMTAMYDAVGKTIDDFKLSPDFKDKAVSFLLVIISDGMENNSKNYNSQAIAERIQELQKTGRWTFTYLGANQDLSQVSKTLGIPAGNTQAFAANAKGVLRAAALNVTATASYFSARERGAGSVQNFYQSPDSDVTPDTDEDTNKSGAV